MCACVRTCLRDPVGNNEVEIISGRSAGDDEKYRVEERVGKDGGMDS